MRRREFLQRASGITASTIIGGGLTVNISEAALRQEDADLQK